MSTRCTVLLVACAILVTILVQWLEGDRISAIYWEETHPVRTRIDAVIELRIERPGSDRILLRKEEQDWRLQEPLAFPAQHALVESIITQLRETRIEAVVEDSSSAELRAAFGLDRPAAKVGWTARGGEQITWEFGALDPAQKSVYVHLTLAGRQRTFLAKRELLDRFVGLQLQSLRSVALVDVSSYAAGALDISTAQGHEIHIVRKAGAWRLVSPEEKDADPAEVRQLIDVLNSWTIEEFVRDGVDPAGNPDYGLQQPRYTVRVAHVDGPHAVTLWVGADAPPSAEGEARVYVARAGEPHVFLASALPLELLARNAASYRNHALVPLASSRIESMRLRVAGVADEIHLQQLADQPWSLRFGGMDLPVDRKWMDGLIESLLVAEAVEFVPLERDRLQKFGLDAPTLELVIVPAETTSESLVVGARLEEPPGARYFSNPRWRDEIAIGYLGAADELLRAPYSLRSLSICRWPPMGVFRLDLQPAGGVVRGFDRLPNGSWKLRGRGDVEIDSGIFRPLEQLLEDWRAERWEAPDSAHPGPDAHSLCLTLPSVRDDPLSTGMRYWIGPITETRERLVTEAATGWTFRMRADRRPDPFQVLLETLKTLPE